MTVTLVPPFPQGKKTALTRTDSLKSDFALRVFGQGQLSEVGLDDDARHRRRCPDDEVFAVAIVLHAERGEILFQDHFLSFVRVLARVECDQRNR
jgi:hypothetical protein